jgi:hemolysin III
MYHAVSGDIKLIWRKVDHIAILFLIAGTYTPVTLTLLYETSGVWILTGVWSIAAVGFIFKIFFTGRFEILSLIMYLGMGWFILLDAQTVWELFSTNAFIFLILGGSCYTIGVFFYGWKGYKEAHAFWHIWVLAGALSHAFMINEILLIN